VVDTIPWVELVSIFTKHADNPASVNIILSGVASDPIYSSLTLWMTPEAEHNTNFIKELIMAKFSGLNLDDKLVISFPCVAIQILPNVFDLMFCRLYSENAPPFGSVS
jgi:hypothetical protein